MGARGRSGYHPTVAAAPSPTVFGELHLARKNHRRTSKSNRDGDLAEVELCDEMGIQEAG